MKGLKRAIRIAGNKNKLALAINASRQLVDYWAKTGKPSPEYCVAISRQTGVPLHELRPDIYPKELENTGS